MRLPEGYERRTGEDGQGLVRCGLPEVPFAAWWTGGTALEGAAGRGTVVQARIGGLDLVLRRYRRGGLLRNLLPDLYPSASRAERELTVLARLARAGVPVVAPVAAIARRRGPGFELLLATERIGGARTLPAFVAADPRGRAEAVERAGRAVAAAFAAGLLHPDLHPDNVLAWRDARGDVRVALLDFDRARLADGPTPESARDAMLVRMARYLHRHADRLRSAVRAVDQVRFLRGLGLDRLARRETLDRLRPKLLRQLRRRGIACGVDRADG